MGKRTTVQRDQAYGRENVGGVEAGGTGTTESCFRAQGGPLGKSAIEAET